MGGQRWLLSSEVEKSAKCFLDLDSCEIYCRIQKAFEKYIEKWTSKIHFFLKGKAQTQSPCYHKLCSGFSLIWGNCRGQCMWTTMDKPHPGKTTFMIMVSPLPDNYQRFIHILCLQFLDFVTEDLYLTKVFHTRVHIVYHMIQFRRQSEWSTVPSSR